MEEMTQEEYKVFMLDGTKTGKLATVRRDGRPHVVPIWYDLDGDDIIFQTGANSVKANNMKRDPRVSITVDDQEPPYSYVQIEGTVTFSDNIEHMLYWATKIGGRYMGEDQAEAFGRRNAVPGEILVRLKPNKILAYRDVTGW
ncbi:MAG: PPOX class F420-dependent oxidoreductase [Thermodesulfobacteriota bacterium]